ncbi:MAG: hypothetical protein KDG44_07435 [Burkholderiaceae bacterium]|nr:hypothetical protein [Burkholderiaceae bacterium]
MKRSRFALIGLSLAFAVATAASAKLPAPSEEAQAKAAEAATKAAWSGKVAAFQLCQSQERIAARYFAELKQAGKEVPTAQPTPACADPGPFVQPAPAAAPAKS